jgi:hypothetical protein
MYLSEDGRLNAKRAVVVGSGAGRGTTEDDQNKEGRGRNERQEHFLFCILSTTDNKPGMGTGRGGEACAGKRRR